MVNAYQKLKNEISEQALVDFGLKAADLENMKDKRNNLHGYITNEIVFGNGYKGDAFVCNRTSLVLPVFMLLGFPEMEKVQVEIEILCIHGTKRVENYYTAEAAKCRIEALEKIQKRGGDWLESFKVNDYSVTNEEGDAEFEALFDPENNIKGKWDACKATEAVAMAYGCHKFYGEGILEQTLLKHFGEGGAKFTIINWEGEETACLVVGQALQYVVISKLNQY